VGEARCEVGQGHRDERLLHHQRGGKLEGAEASREALHEHKVEVHAAGPERALEVPAPAQGLLDEPERALDLLRWLVVLDLGNQVPEVRLVCVAHRDRSVDR